MGAGATVPADAREVGEELLVRFESLDCERFVNLSAALFGRTGFVSKLDGVYDFKHAALLSTEERANYSDSLGLVLPLAAGVVIANVHDDQRMQLDLQRD